MALAMQRYKGVEIAVKQPGHPIPELGVAAGQLSDDHDVHFGINNNNFNDLLDRSSAAEKDLKGLGPRILDIKRRGGRTAEDTWFIIQHKKTRHRKATPGFKQFFDDFNVQKPVTSYTFPAGAKMSGKDVGGQQKY